jgi:hypothetical protein
MARKLPAQIVSEAQSSSDGVEPEPLRARELETGLATARTIRRNRRIKLTFIGQVPKPPEQSTATTC